MVELTALDCVLDCVIGLIVLAGLVCLAAAMRSSQCSEKDGTRGE